MDNLITETNSRLQELIDNLTVIKNEYETKLKNNNDQIETELDKVKKYKEEFFIAKQKIEKMNSDIEGFEADYKNLVERFKDDELANILIAANKEISSKIEERRKKIAKDKIAMNELVELAEECKNKLVKLTAEKKALELCLAKILDSHEYYSKSLSQIIVYSEEHRGDLCSCFYEESSDNTLETEKDTKIADEDDILIDDEEDSINLKDEIDEEEHIELEQNDLVEDMIDVIELTNDDEEDDIVEEELVLDEEDENDIVDDDSLDEETLEADLNITDDDDTLEDIEIDLEDEEDEFDTSSILEDTNHTMQIDDIHSSLYDLNDSLDLENLLGLDDELEDDDSLYENEKED